MDNLRPKHYKNPIDPKTGERYFVPCVIKNRDALVYYTMGVNQCAHSIIEQLPETGELKTNLELYSLRFNDILPDGKKINELTKEDYTHMEKEIAERQKAVHPDNDIKSEEHFFGLTCPHCGNPYVFKSPDEIPYEKFKCGLCDKVLIDYTGVNDWEYEYYEA